MITLGKDQRNVSGIGTESTFSGKWWYPYTVAHVYILSHFSSLVDKSPNSNVIHFVVNVCQHSFKKYDVKRQITNTFRSCSTQNLPSVILPYWFGLTMKENPPVFVRLRRSHVVTVTLFFQSRTKTWPNVTNPEISKLFEPGHYGTITQGKFWSE